MHLKDYTQATFETLLSGSDTKETLHALSTYLKKRGLSSIYPKVLRGILEKQRRHDKLRAPKIIVAREKDQKKYGKEITEQMNDHDAHTETQVDPHIIGGYIVRTHGKQIDNSHKRKLLDAYYKVTQETK